MTTVTEKTDNLFINVLSKEQFAQEQELDKEELYVITQNAQDSEGNAISSKTYADVGRDAVVRQSAEPTSPYTQIWINPDEEVVYITPANSDMDNITETGSANLTNALAPDFTRGTSYSQSADSTFTVTAAGWLYVICAASSAIELKKTNVSGVDLVTCETTSSTKQSNHILLESGTIVYVNRREGTVSLVFYPCKGLAS